MNYKEIILGLTEFQKSELLEFLRYEIEVPKFDSINKVSNNSSKTLCPSCSSDCIIGHGTYKGRSRYLCKSCKKSFNDYTGTAVSGIKKVEKFQSYIKLMLESISIRKAASQLNLNNKTVLDWRHKIAAALQDVNGSAFTGITECDDKLLNINEKGNRKLQREPYKRSSDRKPKRGVSDDKISVVVASDRKGNSTMKVAKRGRIDNESIEKSIGNFVQPNVVICSDKHPTIISWAKEKEIEHHTFFAKNHSKDKIYHVQNVNSIDNLYERWVKPFYGVSTRYLEKYLNWFIFLQKTKSKTNQAFELAKAILENKKARCIYLKTDEIYSKLIEPQYSIT